MLQGDLSAMNGSKAKEFSGCQFCFGVKTLDHATEKLAFGAEPVEQQRSMSA